MIPYWRAMTTKWNSNALEVMFQGQRYQYTHIDLLFCFTFNTWIVISLEDCPCLAWCSIMSAVCIQMVEKKVYFVLVLWFNVILKLFEIFEIKREKAKSDHMVQLRDGLCAA